MERKDNRVIESRVTMETPEGMRKETSYEATTSTEGPTIVWDEKSVVDQDSSRTAKQYRRRIG